MYPKADLIEPVKADFLGNGKYKVPGKDTRVCTLNIFVVTNLRWKWWETTPLEFF